MKSSKYWQQRFTQLEAAQNRIGASALAEIEQQYREAQRQLEGQVTRWYQRFAANNDITLTDARKWLSGADLREFKWDVNDYIQYGKENALTGQWMKELENASAKYHISRLEALKIRTRQSLETLCAKQQETLSSTLGEVYKSGYYHTAFELQKGFNIGWDIGGIDQSRLEKVISKPWAADGYNFSERIWNNKEKLIQEVYSELTRNIMLGEDPQKAIDALAKKMNTSKTNAGRLVMTEEAYFSSLAQKEAFNELGVEQYEIVATLDSHTSDICRSLDGKVFLMKDYEAGVTAPPFHVWCRSTTVPHFDDDFGQIGERAARNEETGETYYVPADMNYKEWQQAFVDGGDKSGISVIAKAPTYTEAYQSIMESITANNVEALPVKKLSKELSDDEIIEKLSGGDMTDGSCSSLAFAYIGNKNGLDVTDFRGGASQNVFSRNSVIQKFLDLDEIKGSLTKVQKELSGTLEIIRSLEYNKEYYLATGKHAAIIRNTEHGLEYLELQSRYKNGWMSFDTYGSPAKTLAKRFGCRKTADKMKVAGKTIVFEKSVVLMDVDSFAGNSEFAEILSYINTETEKQKKGDAGGVK